MGNIPHHGCDGCASHDVDEWGTMVASRAGEVLMAATPIFQVAGVAAYHTSVILGDMEFYFNQQGIMCSPALWSHLVGHEERPQGLQTEVLGLGECASTGIALMRGLQPFFEDGSYDLLRKNCNSFTDAALYFLTRTRLDTRYNRLERMILAASPVSTGVLNGLLWARTLKGGDEENTSELAMNPLAQDFCIEDVVASCDALDDEAEWQKESELCIGACTAGKGCLPAMCGARGLRQPDGDRAPPGAASPRGPTSRPSSPTGGSMFLSGTSATAVGLSHARHASFPHKHAPAEGKVGIPLHRASIIRL